MKPIRNTTFCYGCRKHKMLFESQSKANNFIRYNGEDILEENGKAPVRSYYCEICAGYHVTSNPSTEAGERLNQRDHQLIESLSIYKKEVEEVKVLNSSLSQRLVKIREMLYLGQFDEAEDLLEICNLDMDEIASYKLRENRKLTTLRSRVNMMFKLLNLAKSVLNLSEQEQLAYISNYAQGKEEKTSRAIISNVLAIKKIETLLKENESALAKNIVQGLPEKLDKCRELLATVQGEGKKKTITKYNALIEKQEQKIKRKQSGYKEAKTQHVNLEKAIKVKETPQRFFNEQEYKSTILSLIERLENIQKSFNEGDYDTCETMLEIAYFMLDELQTNDSNTDIVKNQLNQWAERIKKNTD